MPNSYEPRTSSRPGAGFRLQVVVLPAAMAAGIAVTPILGTPRLTQLRPLTRKRLR